MRKKFLLAAIFVLTSSAHSIAQQHTSAGSTAEDMAEEQDACFADARKFCGGNDIFIYEMETCLANHLRQLSPPCRKQIAPTNFRQYYQQEAHPFGF